MIKNEKQYNITKKNLRKFQDALNILSNSNNDKENILYKLKYDSINSQIEVFMKELVDYENLKNCKNSTILKDIYNINFGIIQARISKGYNHKKLAELLGTSEQQIQKYESEDYLNISIKKLQQILTVLDIQATTTFHLKKEINSKKNKFLLPKDIDTNAIKIKIRDRGTTVKMYA